MRAYCYYWYFSYNGRTLRIVRRQVLLTQLIQEKQTIYQLWEWTQVVSIKKTQHLSSSRRSSSLKPTLTKNTIALITFSCSPKVQILVSGVGALNLIVSKLFGTAASCTFTTQMEILPLQVVPLEFTTSPSNT